MVFHPIKQPGYSWGTLNHPICDRERRNAALSCPAQDAKDIVLLHREAERL